jgi:hypothetical protein
VDPVAICLQHLSRAEPSSDFPTADDSEPCLARSRGSIIACLVLGAILAGAIGFVVARALSRRRG